MSENHFSSQFVSAIVSGLKAKIILFLLKLIGPGFKVKEQIRSG